MGYIMPSKGGVKGEREFGFREYEVKE